MKALLNAEEIITHVFEILKKSGLHKKTKTSIAHAVVGVVFSDRWSLHGIAQGEAIARQVDPKHALKQVDRLLSNQNFNIDKCMQCLTQYIVGKRKEVVVAMDWTDFGKSKQSKLQISLVTSHGRSMPILWTSVPDMCLKNRRNETEDALIYLLREALGDDVHITLLADRGFSDTALYTELSTTLDCDFVIRSKGNIMMRAPKSAPVPRARHIRDFLAMDGQPRRYDDVQLTSNLVPVQTVITVHDHGMKEPWFLVVRDTKKRTTQNLIQLYSKRFTCEESFRDEKDLNFGMGTSAYAIKDPDRRDRHAFLLALGSLFLSVLGAAGESVHADKKLKANTSPKRTHSLFRQGRAYLAGAVSQLNPLIYALFINAFAQSHFDLNTMGFI